MAAPIIILPAACAWSTPCAGPMPPAPACGSPTAARWSSRRRACPAGAGCPLRPAAVRRLMPMAIRAGLRAGGLLVLRMTIALAAWILLNATLTH